MLNDLLRAVKIGHELGFYRLGLFLNGPGRKRVVPMKKDGLKVNLFNPNLTRIIIFFQKYINKSIINYNKETRGCFVAI